jgi:hypothetical protein
MTNEADRLGMYEAIPDACENCQGEIETPLADETDPGIVYCSPECRAEFVAAAERVREVLLEGLERAKRKKAAEQSICAHCGERPATCIGRYESMRKDEPACDECCGHACEDGHCEPVVGGK